MIKYVEWGQHLRLGNWLFLYAGLNSINKDISNPLALPPYFLWKYLQNPPFVTDNPNYSEVFHFQQTHFSAQEKQRIREFLIEKGKKGTTVNVNLGAHLQSERWFAEDIEHIKEKLKIKQEEIDRVREKYAPFFMRKTIGVGVRRGDFVGHGCFYQIPEDWYMKAIQANFPDYKDCNIIVFSDNIEECKRIYGNEGWLFADPNGTHTHADNFKHYHKDPMEQFILGILCDNFVGGNSTFTWWQMWYVKNFNGGKVVHCGKNLRGDCESQFYNPDFYPTNWTLHEIAQ